MQDTRSLMGMTIIVEVVDSHVTQKDIDSIFAYFTSIDRRFSTYKSDSEISRINRGELKESTCSKDMQEIFHLASKTKRETHGYFDVIRHGQIDPSGIVKGWAIDKAANMLHQKGFVNFYVAAGGDIQASGKNKKGKKWQVGIKNPFNQKEIVKVVYLSGEGIATSGTYIRGQHVYNPFRPNEKLQDIVSLTVIGPNVYEADRFATAAFAMQKNGIAFIQSRKELEGYMIDKDGIATYTSGFAAYL